MIFAARTGPIPSISVSVVPFSLTAAIDSGGHLAARGEFVLRPPGGTAQVELTEVALRPLLRLVGGPVDLESGVATGTLAVTLRDGVAGGAGTVTLRDLKTSPPDPARPENVLACHEVRLTIRHARTRPSRLALASLEGGAHAVSFASGLAAETALLLLLQPGDHVILGNDVYGGTYRLLARVMSRWGVELDTVDLSDPDVVRASVRPETKVVWVETPTNPLLKIVDIAATNFLRFASRAASGRSARRSRPRSKGSRCRPSMPISSQPPTTPYLQARPA